MCYLRFSSCHWSLGLFAPFWAPGKEVGLLTTSGLRGSDKFKEQDFPVAAKGARWHKPEVQES